MYEFAFIGVYVREREKETEQQRQTETHKEKQPQGGTQNCYKKCMQFFKGKIGLYVGVSGIASQRVNITL